MQPAALESKKVQSIASHQEFKELPVTSHHGIPIGHPPVPLTAEEERVEMQKAKDHFAQQRELMRINYKEMYAALRAAFPIEKCWPEFRRY